MRAQPMLEVNDVEASSSWYQALLGLVSGHGGKDYEMLFSGQPFQSDLALQLHRWDTEEHGEMGDPSLPRGNGISLWFQVPDRSALDEAWARAQALKAEVLEAPHHNPIAHHWEASIRDPDGYLIFLATPFDPDG